MYVDRGVVDVWCSSWVYGAVGVWKGENCFREGECASKPSQPNPTVCGWREEGVTQGKWRLEA